MTRVTFKADPEKSIDFGKTTITGGYITTDMDSYEKYLKSAASASKSGSNNSYTVSVPSAAPSAAGSGTVVAARDYVSGSGLSGITDWDGENVTVGGFVLKPDYVRDGTAYVKKPAVDAAIKKVKTANGIKDSDEIEKAVEKKYGSRIDAALAAIADRAGFVYDPETDPAYAAYRKEYEREGDRAYRKVLNDNNTSATGASGAVLSEAIAGRNAYMDKLTDMIPQLEKDAYDRYRGETERLSDALKALADMADGYYDRMYTASRDSYNNLINATDTEAKEKQRWTENIRIDEQNRIENERNAINDSYTNAQKAADIAKSGAELEYYPEKIRSEINYNNTRAEGYAVENAVARGFFTRADEAVLPWLSAYRTGYGYSINPRLALAASEYDKAHAKKSAEFDAKLGR